MRRGITPAGLIGLAIGLAFLYVPLALVVLYSFNASKLVTVWGGASLRWYGEMLANRALLDAAAVSLAVGILSATMATVVGLLAGLVLARLPRFPGRTAFSGLTHVPLVLPEVITGLGLLLLFVALGWDRGLTTVVLGHATFSTAFVAILVHARLVDFDRSLEEAAMDLGATPLRTFASITLPLITPTLVAGWLLAFTLSLDDLVIASFVSGPGATTLPMRLYSQMRLGVTPEINAASTVMIVVVGVAVIAASLLQKRQAR
jgi:putrescine transport system permease protein